MIVYQKFDVISSPEVTQGAASSHGSGCDGALVAVGVLSWRTEDGRGIGSYYNKVGVEEIGSSQKWG